MIDMKNKRQLEFEEQCHKEAIQKLRKQLNDAKSKAYFSSTEGARQTIKTHTLEMANQLVDHLKVISTGRATTTATAVFAPELLEWMKFVSPEVVTIVLLKSVLDTHGGFEEPTAGKVGNFIGSRLEDEIRFKFYEITAPKEVVDAAWRRVKEAGSNPRYRRISTKIITEKMLTDLKPEAELWPDWKSSYRCSIGLVLLEFAERCGIIEKYNKRSGKKTIGYIRLTKIYQEFFDKHFEEMADIAYYRKPLIEKPLEWQATSGYAIKNTTGGYHTDKLRNQYPMCRGYAHRSEFGELSVRFLNLLGETAYAVDTEIVKVAQSLRENIIPVGSFQFYERDPQLDWPMPSELVELPTDHTDRVDWRKAKKALWDLHNDKVKKAVRTIKSLQTAEEFLKYPRFYLCWSNDYRGRVYPVQPWLSPQTTEFEKSLIRFADGCKLDAQGQWWVEQAIAAANIGTRLNLRDRVQWTRDNIELINTVGSEPLSNISLWADAKEPFQFLQLCIEYYKVITTKQQHLWYVPVGADATSSGLQLLSSALRDEVGMKHSNVLTPESPDAPPEDAYYLVLGRAKELAVATSTTYHLAQHLIHRNLGKTCMVMLYGATHGTVRDKVIKVFTETKQYNSTIKYEDANAITYLLEKASAQVFPQAFKALSWLKKLAKLAANQKPDEFGWKTPSGDFIRYRIFKSDSIDVRLSHLGKVRIPIDANKELDYRKMVSALSPSYVHSLDASLLKIAFDGWTRPLTSIHDCIKVLPTDMDRALEAIRRAFYSVCEGDPLSDLADNLEVSSDTLERLPQQNGDLSSVFGSTYLFN